jgi:hypothetical protein
MFPSNVNMFFASIHPKIPKLWSDTTKLFAKVFVLFFDASKLFTASVA